MDNRKEATSTSDSDSPPRKPRCAKIKYRVRSFYSKGAFLVLGWVLLNIIAMSTTLKTGEEMYHHYNIYPSWPWLDVIPALFGLLSVVPLGWLAYMKVGVHKTFTIGISLLFLSTLLFSVLALLLKFDFVKIQWFSSIIISLIKSLFSIGVVAFSVSIPQLGLDQIPDASSSSITSFITWFLFCVTTGVWVGDIVLYDTYKECVRNHSINSIQLWTLLPVSCMVIALVLKFMLAKKWLIIEPASPQSIKLLYRVLKFAVKHKVPNNCSALTYWEEGVPSRMDMGKSRYGGPFTTEQVEDVKTVLRLFALSIPLFVVSLGINIGPKQYEFPLSSWTDCHNHKLFAVTFDSKWCYIVTALVFEFVFFPLIGTRLPSILRRIGIVSFVGSVVSVIFLLLELIHHFDESTRNVIQWMRVVTYSPARGVLMFFFFCAVMELVYAQAPYNMRGSFGGYMIICVLGPLEIGNSLFTYIHSIELIMFGTRAAISVIGFILYCILASWYKKRVRDDHPQLVVEEIYD